MPRARPAGVAIYAGNDPGLVARIQNALRRRGVIVVELFAREATVGTGIGGFEPGELARRFSGWKLGGTRPPHPGPCGRTAAMDGRIRGCDRRR